MTDYRKWEKYCEEEDNIRIENENEIEKVLNNIIINENNIKNNFNKIIIKIKNITIALHSKV